MNCGARHRCLDETQTAYEKMLRHMVLCVICGNKRCPHATDHSLACTNSNDSGQEGSVYK